MKQHSLTPGGNAKHNDNPLETPDENAHPSGRSFRCQAKFVHASLKLGHGESWVQGKDASR